MLDTVWFREYLCARFARRGCVSGPFLLDWWRVEALSLEESMGSVTKWRKKKINKHKYRKKKKMDRHKNKK